MFFLFQWFGNLVTMEWWNDLWLNEGFAKFMELLSVNVTHPELRVVSGISCIFILDLPSKSTNLYGQRPSSFVL